MSYVGPADHDHGTDHIPKPKPQPEPLIPATADPRLSATAPPPSTTTPAPSNVAVQTYLKSEPPSLTTGPADIPQSPTPSLTHPSNPRKPSDAQSTKPAQMPTQSLAAEPVSLPQIHASPIVPPAQPNVVSNNSSELVSSTPDNSTSEQHAVVTGQNQNAVEGTAPLQTRVDTIEPLSANPTKPEPSLEPISQVQTNAPASADMSPNPQSTTNVAAASRIDDTLPLRQSHAIEDVASLPSVIRRPADSSPEDASPLKRKAENALASDSHFIQPDAEVIERSNKRRNVEVPSTSPDAPADNADPSVGGTTAADVPEQDTEEHANDVEQTPMEPENAALNDGPEYQISTPDQDEVSKADATDQADLATGSNSTPGDMGEKLSSQTRFNGQGTQSPDSSAIPRKSTRSGSRSKDDRDEQDGSEKKSENEYVLPPERPMPTNLPRVAKNRPENARVFIGNLASEYTDVNEIVKVFHKYGTLIEEPVLRRSFGFVQYSCADAAKAAVAGEQGRIIGGIAIDLSIADNREVRKGAHIVNNTPFSHKAGGTASYPPRAGRTRDREGSAQTFEARKRRRSTSPSASSRKGGVHPPQFGRQRPDPRNGVFLRILCMSPTARAYARHCEHTFRTMTALRADVLNIVAANLGEALGRAMRNAIPYVMVVASKDVEDGTCTIRTLEKTGYEKSGRGNGVIPLREAVEVCLIERGILVPTHIAQQGQYTGGVGGSGAPGAAGARGPVSGAGFAGRGGAVGTAQWLNQGSQSGPEGAATDSGKPGWMRGPRAPHPANMRMQANGQTGPLGQVGVPSGPNAAGVPGFGYGGMEGGRGSGYAQGGLGIGISPGMAGAPQGMPAQGGRGDMFATGYGNAANMAAVSSGQEFSRGNAQAFGGGGSNGGFPGRFGAQGGAMRVGNFGPGGSREGEYDPASVVAGSRNAGAYGDWNREQGALGREMIPGGLQGGVNGREHEGNAYGPAGMDGQSQAPQQPPQPFRNVGGYSNGNGGAGGSAQAPYAAERFGQHASAGGVSGEGGQGAMYTGAPEMAGSQPGYDMRNMYGGGGYGEYAGGGMGFRGGDGGSSMAQAPGAAAAAQGQAQGQTHGRMDGQQGQQDPRRFGQEQSAPGYNDGTGRGYQQYAGAADVYGARDQGQRGGPWRNDGGAGGSGATGMHGGMGGQMASGGNGYSMPNRGDVRRNGGRNGAGGAGPTMDIDKLSNLITAFTQKQQQGGSGATAAQTGGQHQAHESSGSVRNNRGRESNGANSTRLTPGGMSQILADPAVQQALQSIGGAGRLGGASAGGSGGGAAGAGTSSVTSGGVTGAAAVSGMWHGHGAQPSVGLGGNRDGRGDASRNDGQQPQHGGMGASGQSYYR